MNRELSLELTLQFGLRERLDHSAEVGRDRDHIESLEAVELRLPALAISWRLEDIRRFACAHHDIGYEAGTKRPVLAERLEQVAVSALLQPGFETIRRRLAERRPLTPEQWTELVEALENDPDLDAISHLALAIYLALSCVRLKVFDRELALTAGGRILWAASGASRALVLYAIAKAIAAAARALPEYEGYWVETKTPPAHATPFRMPAPTEERAASDIVERCESLEPAETRRTLERARLTSGVLGSGIALPSPRSLESAEQTRLRLHVTSELRAAAAELATKHHTNPAVLSRALCIDIIAQFGEIRRETVDRDARRLIGSIDALQRALYAAYGYRGTARAVMERALLPAGGTSDAVEQKVRSLVQSWEPSAPFSVDWPWCETYFVAFHCSDVAEPQVPWSERLPFARPSSASQAQKGWKALRHYILETHGSLPTVDDGLKAAALIHAFGTDPLAAVLYALPSLRFLLGSMRTVGFEHELLGPEESVPVVRQWASLVARAFLGVPPQGQVLEHHIESTLFGSATLDPDPPLYDSEL